MSNINSIFLALVNSLPTANPAGRMRIWRGLKAMGCGVLRDGVYLLPDLPGKEALMLPWTEEVTRAGGTAHLVRLHCRDEAQAAGFAALFDRSEQYRAVIDAVRTTAADPQRNAKSLRALKRDFDAIVAVDFFPGEAQAQARQAISDLEAALSPGEPQSARGQIRRLDVARYQGRTWATRRHLWVDRMASAWLIRRFVDPAARFVWLAKPQDCPKRALGFDFDGAAFTHVGARVSFEALIASFGLEDDRALARIGRIVHFLDVGGIAVAEAAGVEAMLDGMRAALPNDDRLLEAASQAFDFLYQSTHNAKDQT